MEGWQASLMILAYAEMATIEGMKIENFERAQNDESPAYKEDRFYDCSAELQRIAMEIGKSY